MPFQKGPCGEGGRMRGFLLPLLEEVAVVVLVLFLLIFFEFSPLLSQHQSKQKKSEQDFKKRREALDFARDGRRVSGREAASKNEWYCFDLFVILVIVFIFIVNYWCCFLNDSQLQ